MNRGRSMDLSTSGGDGAAPGEFLNPSEYYNEEEDVL
jgi:hypothetical protein